MGRLCDLAFGLFLGGVSLLPSFGQDFEGVDYIRKLEVNTYKNFSETKMKKVYPFPKYDNFCEPLEGEAKNSLDGKVMNLYFRTNECDLTKGDSVDIRRYVLKVLRPYSEFEKITSLNLEGFADCRGDKMKNYVLSHKRSEAVEKYIKSIARNAVSRSIKIYVSAFGEDYSDKSQDSLAMQKDRVVRIIPNESPLEHALSLSSADIFLLDQSGSMGSTIDLRSGFVYDEWKQLQNYLFPDSADVYSYSEFVLPQNMDPENCDSLNFPELNHTFDINTEFAHGATCYYPAKTKLVSSAAISPNKRIATLINGKNDFERHDPTELIEKAKEKNLTLDMIGIDLSGEYVEDFIRIANETGGKYYFINYSR